MYLVLSMIFSQLGWLKVKRGCGAASSNLENWKYETRPPFIPSLGPILKVDNVGGFKVGQRVLGLVLALAHLIVQLRALKRRLYYHSNKFKVEPEAGQGRMCIHMESRSRSV